MTTDFRTFASNSTQADGGEAGQAPTVDPGASEVADGFKKGRTARARWLNWVFKETIGALVTAESAISTLQGFFTASKLKNANLGLLDGGTVALNNALKFSFAGVTMSMCSEVGNAALAAGASINFKWQHSYLRTIDATANQVLDTFTPGTSNIIYEASHVFAFGRTTVTDRAYYHIRHGAERQSGGTTSLLGTVNLLAGEVDTNWGSTTNLSTPAVRLVVTGEAASTIDWISLTNYIEVVMPT